jgi:tRNA(fMet)-specific endonuclease VapC
MSLWILDTDTVSLLLESHLVVSQRVAQAGPDTMISVITVQDIFNGWVVRINNAKFRWICCNSVNYVAA